MFKFEFYTSRIYNFFSIIRNAFVLMLPVYIVSSIVLFMATMFELSKKDEIALILKELHSNIAFIIPTLLTLSVSYFFVLRYELPKLTTAISMSIFFIIIQYFFKENATIIVYFLASILPFLLIPIINFIYEQKWTKIIKSNRLNQSLTQSFNLLIPSLVLSFILLIIYLFYWSFQENIHLHFDFDFKISSSLYGEYIFSFFNSIFWWLGLHGGMLLNGFTNLISQHTQIPALEINNILNAFVFIGGCGATLSLLIAIILVSKQKKYRVIAFSSIPFSLINVNEILVFGIPIIFNLKLLIPFILTPIINVFIVNLALDSGFISISNYEISFSTFIFFNAWIATNEGFNGLAVQIFSIIVGVFVYLPFVAKLNIEEKIIKFSTFNSQFTEHTDEVILDLDDNIKQKFQYEEKNRKIIENLERISKYEYVLFYQPQICPHSHQIIGCESLIRAYDEDGKIKAPFDFLPWFDKAGMNKTIDSWVIKQAYYQSLIFRKNGINIPISVNISANILHDKKFIQYATDIIKKSNNQINIELTEKLLANDNMYDILSSFQEAGAKNYIDDFGTEYSSLSYLYKLPIDAIKIDRSFVLALDTQKGKELFEGILLLAQKMQFRVIVEGVETQEQLDFIKQHDNVSIQGWYYSKALNDEEFIDYYKKFYDL